MDKKKTSISNSSVKTVILISVYNCMCIYILPLFINIVHIIHHTIYILEYTLSISLIFLIKKGYLFEKDICFSEKKHISKLYTFYPGRICYL